MQRKRLTQRLVFRWAHLVRRFFSVLAARPLTGDERLWVAAQLGDPRLELLFDSQPVADQRHAFDGADELARAAPGRRELVVAALMHDVGKRHAALGPVGRAVATGLGMLRIPLKGRLAAYNSHESVGADELSEAGSESVVVLFARHHHGQRPAGIPAEDWEALIDVDRRF